jgi:DNA-binding response OmpR family regulator
MLVLIVEDDQMLAKICQKKITALGHVAHVAHTGTQAVEQFKKEHYGLVLMDVGLPGRDGLGVAKDLKKLDAAIPIVAITAGYSSPEECEAAGISAYFVKPVLMSELAGIVQKWGCACCHNGNTP